MGRWGLTIVGALLVCGAILWVLTTDGESAGDSLAAQHLGLRGDVLSQRAEVGAVPTREPESLRSSTTAAASVSGESDVASWPANVEVMRVRGRVLDGSGMPLVGASVRLHQDSPTADAFRLAAASTRPARHRGSDTPADPPQALTDAAGRFELSGPWARLDGNRSPWGKPYPVVWVHAEGLVSLPFECSGFEGGDHDLGDLVLSEPAAGVRLLVLDASGRPLDGAYVRQGSSSAARQLVDRGYDRDAGVTSFNVVTGADGVAEQHDLWALTMEVRVEHPDALPTTLERTQLVAGETVDLGSVSLVPAPRFTGVVRDVGGKPIAQARVVLCWRSGDWKRAAGEEHADLAHLLSASDRRSARSTETDSRGEFDLALAPVGEHLVQLVVNAEGYEPAMIEGLDSSGASVEVSLLHEARLVVRALDVNDGHELEIETLRATRRTGRWEQGREVTSELSVESGVVRQAGPLGTTLYLESRGYASVLHEVDGVEPGEEREVVVELSTARNFELRVRDDLGEAIAAAQVTLTAKGDWPLPLLAYRTGVAAEGRTDADGRLVLSGLAAGKWRVNVFTTTHVGHSKVIEILDTEDQVHEVVLTRGAQVSGVLLEPDGSPAVAVEVLVATEEGAAHGLTDVGGRFELGQLHAGRWALRAARLREHTLDLVAGETVELELKRDVAATLSVLVLADGAPDPEAWLTYHGPSDDDSLYENGQTNADASGRAFIELEHVGDYVLEINHAGLVSERRDVSVGVGEAQELLIELRSGGAALAGVLRCDLPSFDFTTALLSLREGEHHVAWGRPDAEGRFAWEKLRAGRYTIHTRHESMVQREWGPFDLQTDSVRDDLELDVVAAAVLQGRVAYPTGQPFEGLVLLHDLGGAARYRYGWLHSGNLRIDGLAPGTWELSLTDRSVNAHEAGEARVAFPLYARELVTLEAGEVRELNITIPGAPPN
ncbi:MAG: hypothetical protein DHS20C15_29480 [Planctomycetota bacterium]|nr:MAG: hypothetical protein DHS20C15_29480 [Planctomycetota bacterium]